MTLDILSTSFHRTAISVNQQKPFYSVQKPDRTVNSRIDSLLGMLGIPERRIFDGDLLPAEGDWYID